MSHTGLSTQNVSEKRQTSLGVYKRRLQLQIAGVLCGLFIVWAFLFLPRFLSTEFGRVADAVARLGIAGSLTFVVRWIIFAQDSLATGHSRETTFFRSKFVDKLIMAKYNCSQPEAMALWFHYFNKWEYGPIEYQGYHRMTFSRTYGCRLVYHLRQWLLYFTLLGGATLIANWFLDKAFPNWAVCGAALAVAVCAYFFLGFANKVGNDRSIRPTGCWWKYQEIAEIQAVHLKRDILDRASTFDDAWAVVSAWPDISAH